MGTKRPSAKARLLALTLAAGCAAAWTAPAFAQPAAETQPPTPSLRFAAEELPLAPITGDIRLRADRAWVWREGPTHRIVLERDVEITLGGVRFNAARAVVWLRHIDGPADDPVYQVYAFLERVRTPAADAAVGIEADELPIRAVVRATPTLAADLRLEGPPEPRSSPTPDRWTFDAIANAEAALARAFTNQPDPVPPGEPGPIEIVERPPVRPPPPQGEPLAPPAPPTDRPRVVETPPTHTPPTDTRIVERPPEDAPAPAAPVPTRDPIFRSDGIFFIAAGDRVVVQAGESDNAVTITGGVVVQYQSGPDTLELTAERAVVFLKPGKLTDQFSALSAEDVIGIYLEGEVRATDGQYTLRGPRIYYDVQANRALVLDAVFWTYEQRLGMPLYMRADAIRQEARDQFSANKATLSNTAFFNPDFSIGVSSVTLDRVTEDSGGSHMVMDARNITLRAGPVPFFWWPRYEGDPERIPIRGLAYTDSDRTGAVITSKWDAFSLLGFQPPRDIDATLALDLYADRGIGLGVDSAWNTDSSSGSLLGYILPDDNGTDILARNTEIERDSETRSMLFFRHRQELGRGWTLLAEASQVSDEAFVPALFPDIAREARELTTRLYARKAVENAQFSAELKGSLNDFIIPEHQLQTPGLMVDKLPEFRYTSIGNDLLAANFPGLLSYTWEASYAQMRFTFSEADAASLGFDTDRAAQNAFGTDADQSLGDLYRSLGLDESLVNRFDTRHELSAQLRAGELLITPFAVGRLTVYDDAFTAFSPDEEDKARLWGGVGATIATSFHRTNTAVESELFDIHGLRHIVEPSVTIFHSDTTIDGVDLPVYDDEIESLLEGTSLNFRLANTWQTKRGGPGRWRSVDLLKANIEYVWHSDDTGRETPIGRYYASRPELSVPGEYIRFDATLQLTEALALAGESIYDLEISQQARSSIGVLIEHTPDFLTTAELRYINSQDVTYGRLGFLYRLTNKYRVGLNTTYNFDEADFQNFNTRFYRSFTIGELGVGFIYDNIRGETSFSMTFTPIGAPGARLGGTQDGSDFSEGFGG